MMQCVASCSYTVGSTAEKARFAAACPAPAASRQPTGWNVPRCSATLLCRSCTRGAAQSFTASVRRAHSSRGRRLSARASGSNGAGPDAQEKPEFGYTRKDIILIGGGLIGFGFAMYYGLQAGGVDALVAGNYVQLFIFVGICLGYISTYFIRVANKDMTYVKQLKDYENAVIAKRLEEMPATEKERLAAEVAAERAALEARKGVPQDSE